jgi:mono/diheme cytochrome c family protein
MTRAGRALAGTAAATVAVLAGVWLAVGQPARPGAAHPGKANYEKHCATCHGAGGQADGPGTAALPIKPPPFTDGRLMNPLPDDFLFTVIAKGAEAVGLAPQMPPFEKFMSEREIRDLIAYVRTFASPPYQPPGPPVTRLGRRPVPTETVAPPPAQPVEFSHVIHAGSYQIDCQYCHADARRSSYAGLPSVERCMGCHKIVAAQGNPQVGKVQAAWNDRRAIPWVRIHKLPGFVYFPHKRHVAKDVECQECHGPVERMQRVAQVAPLTMGWCVACHAERKAPLDCVACHH